MNHGPQLIAFTRAQEESDLWRDGHVQKKSCRGSRLAGQEEGNTAGEAARSFYESLLEAPANPARPSHRKRKAPCVRHQPAQQLQPVQNHLGPTSSRTGNKFLKAAQDGDLKTLRMLAEKEGCDVNYRDDYYWTAIMCAAYAGRVEAVRYLLSRGAAWVGVCEPQGRDAMDLAEEAGHQDVVDALRESERPQVKEEPSSPQPPAERNYCAVCRTHYSEDTVALHERSTAHLFNRCDPLPPTRYHIPENNVGFRLMVKGGWDQEAGLGPEGTGRKFPIQTVLKRDQKGLGFSSDLRPKVTHFDANDSSAVERPVERRPRKERAATVGKREARRREAKAQAWERNLRTYMNLDI
ncbi:G patch domain and ankyrin repeat-containing protein 1 [Podarcis raffonei]|uniref:G patch domain and ankyrin repeat-containing protein 1 n=1 Tax=Podarcis raffonei TaxID=65483 RepID=UPI0023294873|nr:G patch domain and ankyrin repeat-containing protein 1 [Podarcis raffonei]XP_053235296.1 G patch domain and ankyrin repeat-containing protein 1 [Podarcis raffonei]XP_053235298.1 G patch domain and ankyrin repeat-containing protein 1 [Podarcis raffonei]XP_053235299.1 G patch domain and ankyrin repeat-containing protein 1 [Podarcis raffonei]